jgi:hypothetical protein
MRHARIRTAFTPREMVEAIVRFHARLGTLPNQWEFIE